ncbi:MAG: hypothetical protein HQ500_02040 [Flavobacteriales bacterium]|nr:hypothetical protein [Flavobacteriales bacterium]
MNAKLQSNNQGCGSNSTSEVFEYEFQGDLVYLIDRQFTNAQECLYGNPVFDASCNKMGTLWQGSTTGEINGE